MLDVLVIRYAPRVDSNTQRLLETSLEEVAPRTRITLVDLTETPPPLLMPANLNALIKRNFMGEPLTEEEQVVVSSTDKFLSQVIAADRLIIAFPMFNFSLPAAVKAWVDVIVQKEKTFSIDSTGRYYGLLKNKAALLLTTTGNDFSEPSMQAMDHAAPLLKQCLEFMGISTHTIAAYGLNQYAEQAELLVAEAQATIKAYLTTDSAWKE
jgi:FMN-dependent NADH-azoreductase